MCSARMGTQVLVALNSNNAGGLTLALSDFYRPECSFLSINDAGFGEDVLPHDRFLCSDTAYHTMPSYKSFSDKREAMDNLLLYAGSLPRTDNSIFNLKMRWVSKSQKNV